MEPMKIHTYEELAALDPVELDIMVAKRHGWFLVRSNYNPDQYQVFAPKTVEMEEAIVVSGCDFELSAWVKAHEFMMKPSTNGHAAHLLLDDLANVPEPYVASHTVIDAYKDLSVVSSTGWGMATQPKVVGKPSEALPRAITIQWLLLKQMQSIPFKQGDLIWYNEQPLYFENVDPEDPTVSWATDAKGKDYELKTEQIQLAKIHEHLQ
jgi:hypothetical protein